jgi:hypothetical protein
MRVFDIYQHPRYGLEAVRRGFSWTAFLVPSVWAVRRGLGWTTTLLVVASTVMFDLAEISSLWIHNPMLQIPIMALLIVMFGLLPGFIGYRWHARRLKDEHFTLKCTVVADGRRQAIRSANDDRYSGEVLVASA